MIKKTTSILLAMLMILSFTAPAVAESSSTTYGKLTFSGATGNAPAFVVLAADTIVAEHPEITVEYIPCDTNTREQILKTAISAGDPPTIGLLLGDSRKFFL